MSRRAERPLPVHLIYVAEACCIEAWVRASKIEHLHAHFGTNSAEVAMLVHILGGPPWSFTAHGTETFDNPGLVGLAEKASRCAFVVAVSSYGRAQICRSLEPPEWSKVHVVHCGLDPEFLAGPPVAPFSEAKRLVCVARLSPEKGHTVLLQAARRLNEEGLSFDLVLAGDGPLRTDIEAMVASYGLQDKVRITGWLSGAEVRREIAASRALLLTSFAEGLPVVLMEAMALSRPVIATYVAGVPELVKPGVHGWLVPAGDVDELAHAMRECLQADRDVLTRMGAAAQTRVRDRHNVDSSARQLAKLFEQSFRKPEMSYSSD
jgi:glycosyltransferase involved in cell wall biosynthesis